MIDFERERLLTFREASKMLQIDVHVSTWHRWAMRGVAGQRLKTVCVGGRRRTTERYVREFFEAVTAARTSRDDQRHAQIEAAQNPQIERELDAMLGDAR